MATILKLYPFGAGPKPAEVPSKEIVGGKGANLIEMARMGLPVPPGIVIPTTECNLFLKHSHLQAQQLEQLADKVLDYFTNTVKPKLGYFPLLSVRSGARVSMPGMMDTLLNIGLTAENYWWWEENLGKACAVDCAQRLHMQYQTLLGVDPPVTLREQLMAAIGAVFRSWNSARAKEYRRLHGYPEGWGTAVTVQSMVFGNANAKSCSGVLFTRDPATGENFVVGEFLPEAQGEDVVAGVRTPLPLHKMEAWNESVLDQLLTLSGRLEEHYRDAQDIEFTVQNGKLYLLQTRNAKRTAQAAFVIAHDMACEGMISKKEAAARVTPAQYQTFLRASIDPGFKEAPTLVGIPASPGVVSGFAVFDPSRISEYPGKPVVLIRKETSPDDFPAMVQSTAILTSTGGATSHAAVVARGINKPAVVGATSLSVTEHGGEVVSEAGVVNIYPGDAITLDGATGKVWVKREVPLTGGSIPVQARALVSWAAEAQDLMVAYEVSTDLKLPESGRYYLSVANLTKKHEFNQLLKRLAALDNLTGVIGFSRPATKLGPDDEKYLSFLGLSTTASIPSARIDGLVKASQLGLLPKKMKKRWLLHLQDATDPQIEAVAAAGWDFVRPVNTLKDLLASNGYVSFAKDFRVRMSEEKVSLEEIVGLLEKAGRSIKQFHAPVSAEDFVAEALGK